MTVLRYLALPTAYVNTALIILAALTGDEFMLVIATVGAAFAFYAHIYFVDEVRGMGETAMGYRSLALRLRQDILMEGLTAGDRLPSASDYAKRFSTTSATVKRALRLLNEEGIVDSVQGRGTYVLGPGGAKGHRNDRPKDQVERALIEIIERNPLGTPMPTTASLMILFKTSHITVRRVQIDLQHQGLIRRTRDGRYVKS